jgi:hypothetical protein
MSTRARVSERERQTDSSRPDRSRTHQPHTKTGRHRRHRHRHHHDRNNHVDSLPRFLPLSLCPPRSLSRLPPPSFRLQGRTIASVADIDPQTKLEMEVAKLLAAAGNGDARSVMDSEAAELAGAAGGSGGSDGGGLADNETTMEALEERHRQLQKLRHLMFYDEIKKKRTAKIKSKLCVRALPVRVPCACVRRAFFRSCSACVCVPTNQVQAVHALP